MKDDIYLVNGSLKKIKRMKKVQYVSQQQLVLLQEFKEIQDFKLTGIQDLTVPASAFGLIVVSSAYSPGAKVKFKGSDAKPDVVGTSSGSLAGEHVSWS